MKTLLITGDDGYKARGLRILAQVFKDTYKVTIVATKEQKSGVGGGLKSYGEKEWGHEVIDGIDSYWVDGTPGDAMEFAQGYFPNGFDYLISGINVGENLGLNLITASGTGGAAVRALSLGISPRVICMSWVQASEAVLVENWYLKETSGENINKDIDYPGKSAEYILEEIIKNDFWGKKIINVNFPDKPTKEYKITKLIDNLAKYYLYPVIIKDKTYTYDPEVYNYSEETKTDTSVDAGAILSGFISITPFDIA